MAPYSELGLFLLRKFIGEQPGIGFQAIKNPVVAALAVISATGFADLLVARDAEVHFPRPVNGYDG